MESTCPNCQTRPADTDVEFDEVLYARYQSRMWAMGWWQDRSIRGFYKSGRTRLCSRCARTYRRVVWQRTVGMRTLNVGFASVIAGAVIFGIGTSSVKTWSTSIAGLILATPMALALVAMMGGGALYLVGRARHRAASRFVERVHLNSPEPPVAPIGTPTATRSSTSSDIAPTTPATPAASWRRSPEERLALRARRQRRRRHMWIGVSVAWIGIIAVAATILVSTVGKFSREAQGTQHVTDSLASYTGTWPNTGACTFHDGAYHIAPVDNGDGVTCYSPAGGYGNLDLQVTARLDSGSVVAGYGLAFRAIDSGDTYIFAVTSDGHVSVYIVIAGHIEALSPVWDVSGGSFATGTRHVLRVVARGDTFTCSVDGGQVGTASDTRYSRGLVGLSTVTSGLDVAFTDFSVSAV